MHFSTKFFSLAFDPDSRKNQDAVAAQALNSERLLVAVADGVGGYEGGEVASAVAVDSLLTKNAVLDPEDFVACFSNISESLRAKGQEDLKLKDMATTLTSLLVISNKAHFAHVGDSRIYHLRNRGIIQRTNDQSEGAELVRQGILSPSRARKYARRSVLTSVLSARGEYQLDRGWFDVMAGDRIALMTDGVYRLVTKMEIRDLSAQAANLEDFSANLQALLLSKGLRDDATAIIVEILP